MLNILCYLDLKNTMSRRIASGLLEFSNTRHTWNISYTPSYEEATSLAVNGETHAIIGYIHDASRQEFFKHLPIPIVNFSQRSSHHILPLITCDNRAIGKIAAEFAGQHHYQNLIYIDCKMHFSQLRLEGFQESIGDSISNIHVINANSNGEISKVVKIITEASGSTGVFACSDYYACWFMDELKCFNMLPPRDYHIFGVDHEDFYSHANTIPITSIDPNFESIGHTCGQYFSDHFEGKPSSELILIPPKAMIEKETTQITYDHPIVQSAMTFIEQNACNGVTIDQIVDHLGYSRRTIEQYLKKELDTTLLKEIKSVQLKQSKRLLVNTQLSIYEIALKTGYNDYRYFLKDFKKTFHLTPTEYRASHIAILTRID